MKMRNILRKINRRFPKLGWSFVGAFLATVFYTLSCMVYHQFDYTSCLNMKVRFPQFIWGGLPRDHNLEDTPNDIKNDKNYDKALSASLPQSTHALEENLRNQKLFYQKTIASRSKLVEENVDILSMIKFYMPQVACPSQVRVGHIYMDGGYFVCNPWVLAKSTDPCRLYSFGINNMVWFETDFYNITGRRCDIYCFDRDAENDQIFSPFNGKFTKALISDKTDVENGRYSILDITRKFGHNKIDLLKVDIEGYEFKALPAFFRNFNGTVCQLILEIHADWKTDGKVWQRFFRMLERRGFRFFYREVYPLGFGFYQFSYIHLSCFEQYGLKRDSVLFRYFD